MLSYIINNIVNYNFNYYKYLDYITNIYKNNYKNDFYTIIINKNIEKNYIYNSCIYSKYKVILIIKSKIKFYNYF